MEAPDPPQPETKFAPSSFDPPSPSWATRLSGPSPLDAEFGITRPSEVPIEVEGEKVGFFNYRICHSAAELSDCLAFDRLLGGFAHYEQQMKVSPVWPVAYFGWLEVYTPFLRQGYGRDGLKTFERVARSCGARCGLMRVGWGDLGPDDVDPQWRIDLYKEEGWLLLRNSVPEFVIPIMYLPLNI